MKEGKQRNKHQGLPAFTLAPFCHIFPTWLTQSRANGIRELYLASSTIVGRLIFATDRLSILQAYTLIATMSWQVGAGGWHPFLMPWWQRTQ
jgi:hypothetical protein